MDIKSSDPFLYDNRIHSSHNNITTNPDISNPVENNFIPNSSEMNPINNSVSSTPYPYEQNYPTQTIYNQSNQNNNTDGNPYNQIIEPQNHQNPENNNDNNGNIIQNN